MAKIPDDIEVIIDRIDRLGDRSLLPQTDAPVNKYDVLLENTFPDSHVVNTTDFDYGRSYSYFIVLTKDRDAASLEEAVLFQAVQRAGAIDQLNIAISAITPYVDVWFIRYSLEDGEVIEEESAEPFTEAQLQALETLLAVLGEHGIRRIDSEVAALKPPGIQTELNDKATVADCLFYG
jgi:hypothetical protein